MNPVLDEYLEDHLDPYSGMDYICHVQETDKDDIAQCQEMITITENEQYREDLKLFYPDEDQLAEHLGAVVVR